MNIRLAWAELEQVRFQHRAAHRLLSRAYDQEKGGELGDVPPDGKLLIFKRVTLAVDKLGHWVEDWCP